MCCLWRRFKQHAASTRNCLRSLAKLHCHSNRAFALSFEPSKTSMHSATTLKNGLGLPSLIRDSKFLDSGKLRSFAILSAVLVKAFAELAFGLPPLPLPKPC